MGLYNSTQITSVLEKITTMHYELDNREGMVGVPMSAEFPPLRAIDLRNVTCALGKIKPFSQISLTACKVNGMQRWEPKVLECKNKRGVNFIEIDIVPGHIFPRFFS